MAMACLGLVTFLPLRPDFSLPCFISRISLSTFFPAEGEYLRLEDFFDFLELDFLDDDPRVLFLALLLRDVREREVLFLELLDFFLVAFLVAITILLASQMRSGLRQVACRGLSTGDFPRVNPLLCVTQCGEFQERARADRRSTMPRHR